MEKSLYNPHDKFFKAMMAEKYIAIDFLKQFLSAEVSAMIDYDSLVLQSNSFLDEELQEVYADTVFRCRMKESQRTDFELSDKDLSGTVKIWRKYTLSGDSFAVLSRRTRMAIPSTFIIDRYWS